MVQNNSSKLEIETGDNQKNAGVTLKLLNMEGQTYYYPTRVVHL